MKSAAFVISTKPNEKRRAIIPEDLKELSTDILDNIFIEEGYGESLGYADEEYKEMGVKVVSLNECLEKDIIVDPKIGDSDHLKSLKPEQIVYGWIHAVQNKPIADAIINAAATAVAWEDMYRKGRHTFWRNNEIAGEAAVMHAFSIYGKFPYETKVAILGNGNVARGANRILISLGADVVIYNRKSEALFVEEMNQYDVIVNALLWDTSRKDHIIYRKDLKNLKRDCLIIDVSCDKSGAVETSIPTSLDAPTYMVDGVMHYVVDHTPTIFYKTISVELSKIVCRTLPLLMISNLDDELSNAIAISRGNIIDKRITEYQHRKN